MTLIQILRKNRLYFIAYSVLLIFALILMLVYSKIDLFLAVNQNYNTFSDLAFRILTEMGNGWFYFLGIVLSLFISYRKTILLSFAFIVQTIVVQSLKHFVFPDFYRPLKYFNSSIQIHFVQGMEIHKYHSFPSGHSASIFCLITLMILFMNRKNYSILLLILAVFVALSRVYLAQHFVEDIVFGSLIGVLIAIFVFWVSPKWIKNQNWMDKKLQIKLQPNTFRKIFPNKKSEH